MQIRGFHPNYIFAENIFARLKQKLTENQYYNDKRLKLFSYVDMNVHKKFNSEIYQVFNTEFIIYGILKQDNR